MVEFVETLVRALRHRGGVVRVTAFLAVRRDVVPANGVNAVGQALGVGEPAGQARAVSRVRGHCGFLVVPKVKVRTVVIGVAGAGLSTAGSGWSPGCTGRTSSPRAARIASPTALVAGLNLRVSAMPGFYVESTRRALG